MRSLANRFGHQLNITCYFLDFLTLHQHIYSTLSFALQKGSTISCCNAGCACSALFVVSDVFDASISDAKDGKCEALAEEVAVELTTPLLRHAGTITSFL
jgi:hypothetical protein